MGEKNNLVLVVGAIVAFVLQIALAPAVALFSAQPNFLLAYALVVAIVIPTEAGPVLPFAMGLLYDLTGTARWAAWRFCWSSRASWLPACSRWWITTRCSCRWPSSRPARFWPSFATACCSWHAGLLPTLWRRCSPAPFPCALYDCAVGLVVYFVMARLLAGGAQDRGLRTPKLR